MEENSLFRTHKELSNMYQRNADMVYRLFYIYLKSHVDVEDAVQSIFIKLIESDKIFNDYEHEKAWFIVITKNYCKDTLKHWWKSRRVDMDDLPEIPYWDKTESSDVMLKLLSLPEKYKTVLYLYYYEGYSSKEIAQILQRKESTVRTQLCTGRERLKIDLGGIYLG